MHRSQFNLFRDIGAHLYGRSSDALRFAMDRIARAEPILSQLVDPQLRLVLEKRAGADGKNINPSLFGYTFCGQCQKGLPIRATSLAD
ncbi:MAG: hypothetical protein QOI49_1822 [Verrucomicrobiota bacterium]|jgi:hypothetical protein